MTNNKNTLKIHLIRHGETQANKDRLYYGFSDIELTDFGRESLVAVKNKYTTYNNHNNSTKFVTSGMKRTNETLQLIFGDVNFEPIPDFKEMNFGDFELKNHAQLENNPDYIFWINNMDIFVIPNGESKQLFQNRVCKAFEKLKESSFNNTDEVFLVSHNGVICVLMEYLFYETDKKKFYEWKLENGESYIININNNQITWEKF